MIRIMIGVPKLNMNLEIYCTIRHLGHKNPHKITIKRSQSLSNVKKLFGHNTQLYLCLKCEIQDLLSNFKLVWKCYGTDKPTYYLQKRINNMLKTF
jgi:hypothetical protein